MISILLPFYSPFEAARRIENRKTFIKFLAFYHLYSDRRHALLSVARRIGYTFPVMPPVGGLFVLRRQLGRAVPPASLLSSWLSFRHFSSPHPQAQTEATHPQAQTEASEQQTEQSDLDPAEAPQNWTEVPPALTGEPDEDGWVQLPTLGPVPPQPRRVKINSWGAAHATGRKKCAVAQVWIKPGSGTFIVNEKPATDYFLRIFNRGKLIEPFEVTDTLGEFDVFARVRGGGLAGQADAMRHGIAKALANYDPWHRPSLKRAQMLRRDPRVVEPKKTGRKKARKGRTWVKR
eukprot:g11817.t1